MFLVVFNFGLVYHSVLASSAQEIASGGLKETANAANLQEGDPAKTIGAVLGVLLSVLGLILLILVVYAGMLWMTAGGDPAKVKKAKDMMVEAVLGLAVCLSAYAITQFVVLRITTAVTGTN